MQIEEYFDALCSSDFCAFGIGYIICMICDVVFSIANYFVERAMYYRRKNKKIKEKEMEKSNES